MPTRCIRLRVSGEHFQDTVQVSFQRLTCLARFFYADERYEDGSMKGAAIDGGAHADFYAQLATREGNAGVPWYATFVKDKGYVGFK